MCETLPEIRTLEAPLRFGANITVGFDLHWLRETAPGTLSGDVGLRLPAQLEAAVEIEVAGGCSLVLEADGPFSTSLRVYKTGLPCGDPRLAFRVLAGAPAVEHCIDVSAIIERETGNPEPALAETVCRAALDALGKKCSAALDRALKSAAPRCVLLKCRSGERSTRDFSQFRLEGGALMDALGPEVFIELHMPFLNRKEWAARSGALAEAQVECSADGRVLVHTADGYDRARKFNGHQFAMSISGARGTDARRGAGAYTLGYSDCRTVASGQVPSLLAPLLRLYGFDPALDEQIEEMKRRTGVRELRIAFTMTQPGETSGVWLDAPDVRDPDFFPVYASVSQAVQRAMRAWTPYFHFSDPTNYEDPSTALPLIVYQCTPVFPGREKFEFARDLVDGDSALLTRPHLTRAVAGALDRVRQHFLAAGNRKFARLYSPDNARTVLAGIQRQPRHLNALLSAEALFVNSLIQLGMQGRVSPARDLFRLASDAATAFSRRLRRFYGGRDATPFASLLLIEAASALNAALGRPAPLEAMLTVEAGALERTFTAAARETAGPRAAA